MPTDARRITIIQGHPDASRPHFCHGLVEAYREGAESMGHEVRIMDVGSISFPILRDPEAYYHQPVPDALGTVQETVQWANHIVIVFPLWMGTTPALLKGFFEQVFRPGFAYENREGGFPRKKLSGRSARIVITMGMPALAYRFYFRAHGLRNMKRGILGFVGFSPIRDTLIGGIESISDEKRQRWLARMRDLGRSAR